MSGLPAVRRASRIKRAVLVRRIAAAVLLLAIGWVVLSAASGYAYRTVACRSCHWMREYAKQAVKSPHTGVECIRCHSYPGAGGIVADGVSMQRMVLGVVTGARPLTASPDDAACISCHEGIATQTVTGASVRVRHSDFIEAPCLQCHGGTGHMVEGRVYAAPEMESCVGCHQVAADHLTGCSVCHTPDSERASEYAKTSWRTTHGPGWKKTHGSGDLATCVSCHRPEVCSDCHGVVVPHGEEWPTEHGRNLSSTTRAQCEVCHDPQWCDECHGIEMPHAKTFLKVHGTRSKQMGESACTTCHPKAACDECHFKSEHPDVKGVTTPHGGW